MCSSDLGTGDSSPAGGLGLYSKFPIDDVTRVGRDRAPFVRLLMPNGSVIRLGVVHATAPVNAKAVGEWTSDLAALGRLLDSTDEPLLFVGDFNAARWQPAFGALLARGLTDAHEARGEGLSRSWPSWFPIFRLDHVLTTRQFAALSIEDMEIPGSDHVGFVVDLAVQTKQPDLVNPAGPNNLGR